MIKNDFEDKIKKLIELNKEDISSLDYWSGYEIGLKTALRLYKRLHKVKKKMTNKLSDQVDKVEILFNYIEENYKDVDTNRLMEKLGIDNIHILQTRTIDKWKEIIDKMVKFQKNSLEGYIITNG